MCQCRCSDFARLSAPSGRQRGEEGKSVHEQEGRRGKEEEAQGGREGGREGEREIVLSCLPYLN